MLPGAHPFAELDAALLRSTMDAPASLGEQLRDGDAGLLGAALRILPDDDSHLVLIIDQFEELFTLVDDPAVRERFLSNLVTAVDDPHHRISVVLTLRADFYAHQLSHPEFGARLGNGIVNVTQLTAEELEAAALRPAEEQGVSFEPALLGQLIADVGNQPGALPLFQYALTELFDRRTGDVLTAASYRAMGGLDGALQRRASDLFDELDDQQQNAARQLFLRLVVIGDGDQRSRRRVPAREVASLSVDPVAMQTVIERFGEHRLLSFDSDHLTGAPTVEVAHEALLTAWPTLEGWVDESRDDLRRHASLSTALHEWTLADEDPDYLLTSARVAEFDGWADVVADGAERPGARIPRRQPQAARRGARRGRATRTATRPGPADGCGVRSPHSASRSASRRSSCSACSAARTTGRRSRSSVTATTAASTPTSPPGSTGRPANSTSNSPTCVGRSIQAPNSGSWPNPARRSSSATASGTPLTHR